ncbi:MAG: iron-sulfur cluster insertion protein ErpA [Deltaproteobacteria bacterium]|nr:iron-sulfur cluster insertion protein ErpA [Deltaproteobacteria bacterium]
MQNTSFSTPTPLSEKSESGPGQVLFLTDRARTKVKEFAQKTPDAAGKNFRVYVEGGGCSGFQYGFSFDAKKDEDMVVDCDGVSVLIDPQSKDYLAGSTVDFVESLTSSGFAIKNPNAKASCGCGTSFTV